MSGKRKFTIYLDDDLIKTLKKIAINEETSVSAILNKLGWEYVQKTKDKESF
jgi:predicted transcriptional regulator